MSRVKDGGHAMFMRDFVMAGVALAFWFGAPSATRADALRAPGGGRFARWSLG